MALGTDVIFVLPRPISNPFSTHVRLVSPQAGSDLASPDTEMRLDEFEHVTFRTINADLTDPYEPASRRCARTPSAGKKEDPGPDRGFLGPNKSTTYSGDLFSAVQRYAMLAAEMSRRESFDVVHAHDWMTFPAGLAVSGIKGVPLVVHVHSTEFDRSGVYIDQRIYDIERRGMHGAMKVIAVSYLTKNQITHQLWNRPGQSRGGLQRD